MSIKTLKLNHSRHSDERFDSVRYLNLLENTNHSNFKKATFISSKLLTSNITTEENTYPKIDFTEGVDPLNDNHNIPFNRPPYTANEDKFVAAAMHSSKLSGDGAFSKQCQTWFENYLGCSKALLTPSCTHALEMAALLIDTKPGDEIIMPSYTFVSTANAFALRGAKIIFVDIRKDTMNIDETKIEAAITKNTKAIVPVHYAGVACEMDTIMKIAHKYKLWVIEDAAQAMTSQYKGKPLGSIGHLAAFSFHETKNFTSGGEGGLLIVNKDQFVEQSEIIREKGTNRSRFLRGDVDKYTWVDKGSSYLLNDLSAAYLWGQLQKVDDINKARSFIWHLYDQELKGIEGLQTPTIPEHCDHNSHMYFIKTVNIDIRDKLIKYLSNNGVLAVFHYVPLHSSPAGKSFGSFVGHDRHTSKESKRVLRLPIYFSLEKQQVLRITGLIKQFFSNLDQA